MQKTKSIAEILSPCLWYLSLVYNRRLAARHLTLSHYKSGLNRTFLYQVHIKPQVRVGDVTAVLYWSYI